MAKEEEKQKSTWGGCLFMLIFGVILLLVIANSRHTGQGVATLTPNPTALFRRTEFVVRQTVEALGTPWPPYSRSTPQVVTLVCQECADAGMQINLWVDSERTQISGSVPHGTTVTVLNFSIIGGRVLYQVRVGNVVGWVTSNFIKK